MSVMEGEKERESVCVCSNGCVCEEKRACIQN